MNRYEALTLGPILVDIAMVAVIIAFAAAGYFLAAVRSGTRLVASLIAFAIAVVAMRPVAWLFERALLPTGVARIAAMFVVALAAYLALVALARFLVAYVPHERLAAADRPLGAVFGGILGGAWAALMLSVLVLSPATGALSHWPIQSTGGSAVLAGGEPWLRWLSKSFPRYTQTLPKGRHGARVEPVEDELPLHDVTPRDDLAAAGELYRNINALRHARERQDLVYNVNIARSASRHSRLMLRHGRFDYTAGGGGQFKERLGGASGGAVADLDVVEQQIVWAHATPNAVAALVADEEALARLTDERIVEIGIGAVDGGWFNGTMYTIGLLGRSDVSADDPDSAADASAAEDPFA